MPMMGCSFDSVGLPVSSTAVTATDAVRLACAVNSNQLIGLGGGKDRENADAYASQRGN